MVFQAIIISDYTKTFTIFIYKCGPTLRPLNAIIGYSIVNFSSETFRYSETPFTQKMACINTKVNVEYYNLIYSLTEKVPGTPDLYILYMFI